MNNYPDNVDPNDPDAPWNQKDPVECDECKGTGFDADNGFCVNCDGTGEIND